MVRRRRARRIKPHSERVGTGGGGGGGVERVASLYRPKKTLQLKNSPEIVLQSKHCPEKTLQVE